MRLNINRNAVVSHTNRLEKLHKSALPNAVRSTLNNAVYDVKTKTMPASADKTFTNRQKNFFKANSRFEKATGFNVDSMKATVGFIEGGLKGGNNYAVKDLEEQEDGGTINRKAFIPLKSARIGKSAGSVVRANARLSNIKKIINTKSNRSASKKQAFAKSAIAAGPGGFVLSGKTLWKINSFKRNGKINKTALYNFKKSRSVNVKGTNFMRKASLETAGKMERDFIKEANRQIAKLK
jgi:hypothetical protein